MKLLEAPTQNGTSRALAYTCASEGAAMGPSPRGHVPLVVSQLDHPHSPPPCWPVLMYCLPLSLVLHGGQALAAVPRVPVRSGSVRGSSCDGGILPLCRPAAAVTAAAGIRRRRVRLGSAPFPRWLPDGCRGRGGQAHGGEGGTGVSRSQPPLSNVM